MRRVYDFLKNAETYYLATIDEGTPRVRPFGTVNIFNDKLYIQTGKGKDVYNQILKNPRVEICAMLEGDWIRVNAELVLDDNIEAQEDMLNNYPHLRALYTTGAEGNTACFYMRNAEAVIASFTKPGEEILF